MTMAIKDLIKKTAGLAYLNTIGKAHLRRHPVILMMHRVIDSKEQARLPHNNPLCIDKNTFADLLVFLKKHFDIVDLEEAISSTPSLKPKLALTFDDGWKDNLVHAFPLLKQHKVPATIFLSTDYIGNNRGFWWQSIAGRLWEEPQSIDQAALQKALQRNSMTLNPALFDKHKSSGKSFLILAFIHSLKDLEPQTLQLLAESFFYDNTPDAMDWSDIRYLEESGLIKFGPHGHQHFILTQLDQSACAEDLQKSDALMTEKCSKPLKIYCYPNGNNNSYIHSLLNELGYSHALSTQPGLISDGQNNFCLPRIDVSQRAAEQPGLLAWRILQGSRIAVPTIEPQQLRSLP